MLVLTSVIDGVIDMETLAIALGPDGDVTNGFDSTGLGTNVGGGANPNSDGKSFNVQVNDTPLPEITVIDGMAATECTAAVFAFNASLIPASNLTVNLSVTDAPYADFWSAPNKGGKSVTVIARQAIANFTVPTTGRI